MGCLPGVIWKPGLVDIYVDGETCRDQQIPPINLRQPDRFLKPLQITLAQFERSKTDSIHRRLAAFLTKRKIVSALLL